MNNFRWLFSLVFITLPFQASIASDHQDGPSLTNQSDIVDLYSFVNEERNKLVLLMTIGSQLDNEARLSENILYQFRIRPADISTTGKSKARSWKVDTSPRETLARCRALSPGGAQTVECWVVKNGVVEQGLRQTTKFNELTPRPGFSVFAGSIHDPFFSNVFRARLMRPRNRQQRFLPGTFNTAKRWKTIGLAVELPLEHLDTNKMVAVVAETIDIEDSHHFGEQIDRMGNVEVTNFALCMRPPLEVFGVSINLGRIYTDEVDFVCSAEESGPIKDQYNQDDTFNISNRHAQDYYEFFTKGLTMLDGMDSSNAEPTDWPTDGNHPFIKLFTHSDFLMVDLNKPCVGRNNTYLDVQMSTYLGREHKTCGGRLPNDDTIDILLTVLINGPIRLPEGLYGSLGQGVWRRDKVPQPSKPAPLEFPWLNRVSP